LDLDRQKRVKCLIKIQEPIITYTLLKNNALTHFFRKAYMRHNEFVNRIIEKVKTDSTIVGLAASGSRIDYLIDKFSDIDLVLITEQIVSNNFDKMYGLRIILVIY
jgi:hypothetical protein